MGNSVIIHGYPKTLQAFSGEKPASMPGQAGEEKAKKLPNRFSSLDKYV
jgi:hypothetical protein